jgi:guanylate kinase
MARVSASAGRLFVISSPSGGGKTTVVRRLLRLVPGLVRSVSVTTRAPRRGEREGRDYRFISPAEFRRLRRQKALLEWARVHDAYYGTPRAPIEAAMARGRRVILSIDVQGAAKVRRALGKQAALIFLLPPSLESLRQRLVRRRTDAPAVIRRRLAAAKRELACARRYDWRVVNDRLPQTVRDVKSIIVGKSNVK